MKIKTVEFYDYKSFGRFTLSAKIKNILVGPNNAGKSTTLDALRITSDVLRFLKRRTATLKSQGSDGVCSTYFVPHTVVQTDLRYCVHNFADTIAKIEISLTNGNKLVIKIDPESDLECYIVSEVSAQSGTQYLRNQFPLEVIVVPTLSPLEQNEEVVRQETIERNRYGRLASRNFRNFWLHRTKEEFEEFSDLVALGWPGVRLMRPEIERGERNTVRMYFREGPNVREVQWAGFGFQVWMQTMMHLTQSDHRSTLVLDEPDIYLHPDLQHRLLRLTSQRVGQFFIATHSTEIINAADPGDVLIVRPTSRSAKRIRSDENYPEIYAAIGSSENAQFARLARTKKVLYFEGSDMKLLSKLSKNLGGLDFVTEAEVTLMRTDGFSNWGRVPMTAWVFKEFFDLEVTVAALFDRDYRCEDEVFEFEEKALDRSTLCFVLPFKEIENVLLSGSAIKKVIKKYSRKKVDDDRLEIIDRELDRVLESYKDEVFGQRVGHFIQYKLAKNPGLDAPTLTSSFQRDFTSKWNEMEFRLSSVPGKKVFSNLSRFAQEEFSVTLTPTRVCEEISLSEMPQKLIGIFSNFREYFGRT